MKPIVVDFSDDINLIAEIDTHIRNGVSRDNLYVISHDDDRTKRIIDQVNVNEVGMKEEGFKVAVENFFNSKGDELRAKFEAMEFSPEEAEHMEQMLDHGKVLLLIKTV